MLRKIPLKSLIYGYMWVTSLQTVCTHSLIYYDLCTSRNVLKNKIFGVFPHKITNNLTIGLPYAWKCFDLTLHLLFKGYILRYLDSLEEDNFERKYTIVELCAILMYLSLHPFVLEATISVISQACLCMED